MRGVWIFLAVAAGALITSPAFWWLIASEASVAPGRTTLQDGTVLTTLSGPKAPWPDWVYVPERAQLDVQMAQLAVPGHSGGGLAYLTFHWPQPAEIAALKANLSARGWDVSAILHRTPEPAALCIVTATKLAEKRTVRYNIFPGGMPTQVLWSEGIADPAPAAASAETC